MKHTIVFVLSLLSLTSCLYNIAEALPGKQLPKMKLKVGLDLERGILTGSAQLNLDTLKDHPLIVRGLKITGVENNSRKLPFTVKDGRLLVQAKTSPGPFALVVNFEKALDTDRPSGKKEFLAGNFSSKDFALLMANWCPLFLEPALYDLEVQVKKGLIAVSEADEIRSHTNEPWTIFKFSFPHPREEISLVAGKFHINEHNINGIIISTYFLDQDKKLSDNFLKKASQLISLFSQRISPYPFKRFSIVENLAPSGLSFPTFTLIGRQIIRMPFVMEISLGHEILHSWFGNSVYVDYSGGNWCEGLTTYLADHYFYEEKGEDASYRHQILCDYKSFVHKNNAIALSTFKARTDRATKAIGYGKGAMVFHMLRNLSGEKSFLTAISDFSLKYRFKKASWKDIEAVFSKHTSKDLDPFFSQWLYRKDVPKIEIQQAEVEQKRKGDYLVRLTIEQNTDDPYRLQVPLTLFTRDTEVKKVASLTKKKEIVSFTISKRPLVAVLDKNYDIMRDLAQEEFPPSISRLFGAEKRFVIMADESERQIYGPILDFLKAKGFELIPADKLKHATFKTGSFVILGDTSGKLAMVGPEIPAPREGLVLGVRNNPLNPDHVTCAIHSSSKEECRMAMYKIPHYGKYSFLRFKNGKIEEKCQADYERGIQVDIEMAMYGIKASDIKSGYHIIDGLTKAHVIYLGERHDQQGIHEAQLRIIKAISQKGPVAVAMEMFQKPFQGVIDAYLQGDISERDFLRKTEYFKRWGFNYHFYRPIVEFCKKNRIPIIAMNLPAEISKKIARSGLEELTAGEKGQLPSRLDLKNPLYRRILWNIYQGHEGERLQSFERFVQAQIAWDETMAESIVHFSKKNPGRKIIVIVGGGHVAYGYGIPSRVKRRMKGINQSIVLFPAGKQLDPMEADYFLFIPEKEAPFVAKLGVLLSGKNKLKVESVVPESPAAKGGIQKGDIITAIDGHKIQDIYDLKLDLFFKNRGQSAKLTILRTEKDGKTIVKDITTGPLVPFEWNRSTFRFHGKK